MYVPVFFVQLHPYFLAYVEVYLRTQFIMPLLLLLLLLLLLSKIKAIDVSQFRFFFQYEIHFI